MNFSRRTVHIDHATGFIQDKMKFARTAGKTLHYMSKFRVGHRNKCFHAQIRMMSWMSHWDCKEEVKNNEIDARF